MRKVIKHARRLRDAIAADGIRGVRLWWGPVHAACVQYFQAAWGGFWVRRSGLGPFGRLASRLATLSAPPAFGRWQLALLSEAGYVAPRAVVYGDIRWGKHTFIGDSVVLYTNPYNGGSIRLGQRVRLYQESIIGSGEGGRIEIGDDTHIHERCHFTASKASIVIGRRVQIATNCSLFPYNHGTEPDRQIIEQPLEVRGDILIDDDAWLGTGVIVLTGVRIGKGAIIGAGAVVTRNVPDGAIALGVPARVIRRRGASRGPLEWCASAGTMMLRALNGTIRFWNKEAEEFYGWTTQDAIGRRSHDVLRTEFPIPLKEIEAQLLRTGLWEGPLTHTRRDGTKVVVNSRWELQRDAAHEPLVVLEINRPADTATVHAPSHEPTSSYGTWTWDLVANTMAWSDDLLRLYEIEGDHIGGSYNSLLARVPEEDRVMIQAIFERAGKLREPFAFLHRLQSATGGTRTIQVHGEPITGRGGVVLFGAAYDVTRRVAAPAVSASETASLEAKVAAQAAEIAALRRDIEGLRHDLSLRR
ncbi:MAG TPA: PAS domain S-box protein [Nitrospirales bacterium]|nr:PAS domain S-box protein [Nitrospirales bacterium]